MYASYMEATFNNIESHSLDACIVGDTVVAWTWANGPAGWYREYAVVRTMAEARNWLGC